MAIPGTYQYPTGGGGTPGPAPAPTPAPGTTPAPMPGRGGWLDWLRQLIEGSQTGGAFNWDTFMAKLREGRPGAGVGGWPTGDISEDGAPRNTPSTEGSGAGGFKQPAIYIKDMAAIQRANPDYLKRYEYSWPGATISLLPWESKDIQTTTAPASTGGSGGSSYFGGGGGGTASGSGTGGGGGGTGGGFGGWSSFLSSLFGR